VVLDKVDPVVFDDLGQEPALWPGGVPALPGQLKDRGNSTLEQSDIVALRVKPAGVYQSVRFDRVTVEAFRPGL
jgi:hypothetical protein